MLFYGAILYPFVEKNNKDLAIYLVIYTRITIIFNSRALCWSFNNDKKYGSPQYGMFWLNFSWIFDKYFKIWIKSEYNKYFWGYICISGSL
jgi:peptidoglycan biosynthesis protein MviN/MurJ (putative lipid II flippase)